MRPLRLAGLTLACLFAAVPARALDLSLLASHQFSNDFDVSYRNTGELTDLADTGATLAVADGAALIVAADVTFMGQPDRRIGVFLSQQRGRFESSPDLADRNLQIKHLHFVGTSAYPQGNWEPFVLAGLGVAHFAPDDPQLDAETRVSAQLGAGVNYRLFEQVYLRGDLRWVGTFFNGGGSLFCSGGCQLDISADTFSQAHLSLGVLWRR